MSMLVIKRLTALAAIFTALVAHAQLPGPLPGANPFLYLGPRITTGGSGIVFDAPLTTSIVPRKGGTPTFTRATEATVFDHEGILRTVKTSEARFYGAMRVENLLTKTENISHANWQKGFSTGSGPTIIENVVTAPNGALLADKVVPANGSGDGNMYQTPTLEASGAYNESIFAKAAEWAWVALEIRGYSGDPLRAWFNLASGTIGTVQPGLTAEIESFGDGWYRCSIARAMGTNVSSTRVRIYPAIADNAFPTGDGVSGIYVWGAAVTMGSARKPYVSHGVLLSPYHGAGIDGVKYFATNESGAAISDSTLRGYYSEGQRTNYLLYSRDLTNAAWTKTSMTAALDQTGIDGRANSASSLLATAANATAAQAITRASAQRISGWYIKRLIGTGTVEISQDNGATWTAVTGLINGSTYTRVATAAQTLTNPTLVIRIATSGDKIAVDYGQHEEAAFLSSPILTTTLASTRNDDVLQFAGINWPLDGAIILSVNALDITTPGWRGFASINWANGFGMAVENAGLNLKAVVGNTHVNSTTAVAASQKIGLSLSAVNRGLWINGTNVASGGAAPTMTSAHPLYVGSLGGSSQGNAMIKDLKIYKSRNNAAMQTLTTP